MGFDGAEVETEDEYQSEELHAFYCFLAGLSELGYGFAYRVLDAQYVRVDSHPRAVPQRRRRVFVVGYLGDWRPAAAVLLEREGMRGDPAPRRKAGQRVTDSLTVGANQYSGFCGEPVEASTGDVAHCLETTCNDYSRADGFNMVAHALRGRGFDASEDGCGRGTPLVPVAFSCKDSGGDASEGVAPTLRAMGHGDSWANGGGQLAVAFDLNQITSATNRSRPDPAVHHTLPATACPPHLATSYAVRRLTPTECERLQGFPDGYTAVPYRGKPADACPDGPRYKALGNSMAVNVMSWIGQRIAMVDAIVKRGGGA
jgi:DNA (cytosine-5)-methyltransferase 1